MGALEGVAMELDDCAFPLLEKIELSDQADQAFEGANVALLVGSRPRSQGMERKDLLEANGEIFTFGQGAALNDKAAEDLRVLVVGNPANTNCLISNEQCTRYTQAKIFSYDTFGSQQAITQVAQRLEISTTEIKKMTIWGNHSATQYPDLFNCRISDKSAAEVIDDQDWIEKFYPFSSTKRCIHN